MSLQNVDLGSAMRRLADKRIEEAIAAGKFDNLPGRGQPIEIEDAPAQEDARLLWWALRILRKNDVIPDEVKLRKAIESMKDQLAQTSDLVARAALVDRINEAVRRLNTLGTNAMNSATPVTGI